MATRRKNHLPPPRSNAIFPSLRLGIVLSLAAAVMSSALSAPPTRRLPSHPAPQSTVTPALTPTMPPPSSTPADSTTILRAQLDVMRSYDQRLLTTVYWSLGVVATLAILIAGFSWFSNFKLYERDKKALAEEMALRIDNLRSELTHTIAQESGAIAKSIPDLISTEVKSATAAIKESLTDLSAKIANLQIDLLDIEAMAWQLKGVHNNVITVSSSALKFAIRLGNTVHYSTILNRLLEAVDKVDWLIAHDVAEVTRILDQLPPEHAAVCAKIKAKMNEKLQ